MARRRRVNPSRSRVLTAAAQRIDVESKEEAQLQRKVRQNWQLQAWTYRDSIPELRFAVEYIAHCAARMRVFVAVLPTVGETGTPVDIHDPEMQVPQDVITACDNALRDLGNGRLELAKMMKNLSTQWSVAGEGFLLGVTDPVTQVVNYSIRSISEIVVNDDKVELREGPMTNQGIMGLVPLPADSMVTRLWSPHPQYRLLADSPLRALLNTCEDIMIMRRMIRAIGRNRLAGRGLLLMPSESGLPIFNDDNDSLGGDSWYDEFTTAMITPIRNEGDASAAVPMVTEMPGNAIEQVRWIEFSSAFDENAAKIRDELLETLATGLDLPKEVITGMADLNHWTAWTVDANTFRNHIEPHVLELTDALTCGYLRNYLATSGLDPDVLGEWLDRVLFWHDPTELVTSPDMSTSAFAAHAQLVISDDALRRYAGFSEADAPSPEEIEIRMVRNTRNWPVNALMAFMHALDPTITIPPVTTPNTIPGIQGTDTTHSGGVVVPLPPVAPSEPTPPDVPSSSSEVPNVAAPAQPGPPPTPAGVGSITNPVTASGATSNRFAWQMMMIDRELRTAIQVAANDEMRRQLEKLGNKLRRKVARNTTQRNRIALTHNEHVAMMLGPDIVRASGYLTAAGHLQTDWSDLESKFVRMVTAAQARGLKLAAAFAGLSAEALALARKANAADVTKGWEALKSSMDQVADQLTVNPDPNVDVEAAIASMNPDSLVSTSIVRQALSIAGGMMGGTLAPDATPTGPPTGVVTGPTMADMLSSAGIVTSGYEWVHGPSERVFEPHEDLDGQEFESFTSDVLRNDGDWPPVEYFYPGDHDGCLCDAMPQWAIPSEEE